MSSGEKRPRAEVLPIAQELAGILRSSCERLEIAGSLRRETKEVGDIELVAIPRVERFNAPAQGFLFPTTETREVNRLWEQVDLVCRGRFELCGPLYRQFFYKKIKVDIFTATPKNWGWILAIRTGPWEFSRHLCRALNKVGYTSNEGQIFVAYKDQATGKLVAQGDPIDIHEEDDVFALARIPIREPKQRF